MVIKGSTFATTTDETKYCNIYQRFFYMFIMEHLLGHLEQMVFIYYGYRWIQAKRVNLPLWWWFI